MLNIRAFVFNLYQENTYILTLDSAPEAVIVDPGCTPGAEQDQLLGWLEREGFKPVAVLLTHAHPDHIGGVKALQARYGLPDHRGDEAYLSWDEAYEHYNWVVRTKQMAG